MGEEAIALCCWVTVILAQFESDLHFTDTVLSQAIKYLKIRQNTKDTRRACRFTSTMEEEKIDYFYLTMRAPVGESFYTDMVPKDAPDELRRLIEAYSDAQKNVTNETAAACESKNTHALDRAAKHLYSTVVAVREYRDKNPNNILAKKMAIMCAAYSEGPCCHAVPDAIMNVRIELVADGATPKQLSDEFGVYPRPLCVRDENKHKLFGQEMGTWSPAHDVLQYIQIVLRDLSYDIDELVRDVNGKSKF